MNKIIGKHKNESIFIFELHMVGTYDDTLCGFKSSGKYVIDDTIPRHCKKYFGEDVPIHIAGKETIDLTKSLPDDTVYAYVGTHCMYCGNYLALVWFQKADMDPHVEAQKHLKKVDWDKEYRESYC